MQSNLNNCITFVLQYEGGYVNNPKDPGGPTNLGITQMTLSHELGRQATINDVRGLTRVAAVEIYRKKYWNVVGGDALPLGVDLLMVDIAVNSGPGRAQQWYAGIEHMAPRAQIIQLDQHRRSFWRGLKTFAVFGKGWMRREDAALALAMRMAA